MWYNALAVARYIITRCSEFGRPVSNLKLQKLLYFLWIDFHRQTGRNLFLDDICAWQLGPVVPEVYYEYCSYAGRPIWETYELEISNEDMQILDEILKNYIDVSASELVNRTHRHGSAWDIIYRNGLGNRKVIPFPLIVEREEVV